MAKLSKRVRAFREKVDPAKQYPIGEAVTILNDLSSVKFKESIDVSINLGVEYADVEYSQAGPIVFGDPNYQTDIQRTSVFADNTYALFDDVWLNASVRYTDNSEFASATDYRVGSSWQVNAPLRIFVSHGRASKTPTFTERFGFSLQVLLVIPI